MLVLVLVLALVLALVDVLCCTVLVLYASTLVPFAGTVLRLYRYLYCHCTGAALVLRPKLHCWNHAVLRWSFTGALLMPQSVY